MKNSFYKNTFILTASNITVGILGFIFAIYLSKLLGPVGMALYSLVMPIYNLFIAIMTAGVIASISKISAIYSSQGDNVNLFKTLKTTAIFNFVWASIIGVTVFCLSKNIGLTWVKDARTINAIKITCPAMVCIALSNILKGYFYGTSKLVVPSFIDILEKSLRILIVAALIYLLNAKSLSSLVTVAYIALCIGEFQSLILLFIFFKKSTKSLKTTTVTNKSESKFQLLANVLIISLPLCLTGFLNNIFHTISALIVPRRLLKAGFTYTSALSMIGKYTGMATNIVFFPAVIIGSLNTLLIPDLSQSLNRKDYYSLSRRIKSVLKLVFLIGLATTVICQIIPNSLGKMFFGRNDLGNYIKAASLGAPLMFLSGTMYGILNGLNKQVKLLRNSLIVEILEVICLFFLSSVPSINVYSYFITEIIVSSLALILNFYEIQKVIEIKLSIPNIIIFILISILSYFVINFLFCKLINLNFIVKSILVIGMIFSIFISIALKYKTSEIY